MKVLKKHLDYLCVVFAYAALFFLVYNTCGFYYAINDDMTMQKLAAGSITGVPDGHLIFIRYLLGFFISWLFKIAPQYDWYGITLLGLLFLCFFLILCRFFTLSYGRKNCWLIRSIGIGLSFFLFVDSALFFQFTVVSGVLAATALFYLASSSEEEFCFKDYILAWILILLACLVRIMVFYMVLPLAMVIIIAKLSLAIKMEGCLYRKEWPQKLKKNRKVLLALICITIIGVCSFKGISFVEKAAYSNTPWKEYQEYKHARSLIKDYYGWPGYYGNEDFWKSLDVSSEEFECRDMYGILPNWNMDKIIAIGEYAEDDYHLSVLKRLPNMAEVFLSAVKDKSICSINLFLLFTMVFMALCFVKCKSCVTKMAILCGVLIETSILIYLLYRGRLPSRIVCIFDYQCILACAGVLLIKIVNSENDNTKIYQIVWLTGTLMLVLVLTGQKVDKFKEYKHNVSLYQEEMEYVDDYPDEFFVVPTMTFFTSKKFTFYEIKDGFLNTIGTSGWSTFSPWTNQKLESYGLRIQDNILLQPDVYMLTADLAYADSINRYFLSEGFTNNDYEIIDSHTFSNGREVHKVRWTPAQ